jgi:hypothetical protein
MRGLSIFLFLTLFGFSLGFQNCWRKNAFCLKSYQNAKQLQENAETKNIVGQLRSSKFEAKKEKIEQEEDSNASKVKSALEQVASKGLAGVLAIALAEAIFWAAGMPLASLWVKMTTGHWINVFTTEGQLQAAGFTFGYGGFATLILQYRVTLFAIPLVPIMEKFVIEPGKKIFGENFGDEKSSS